MSWDIIFPLWLFFPNQHGVQGEIVSDDFLERM